MRRVSTGIIAALMLAGSQAYAGTPDSYLPLGKAFDVPVTLKLKNDEAHTVLKVSLGSAIEEKVGGLYLRMDADLSDLEAKAQAIVGTGLLNKGCTDRVWMTDVTLKPVGKHAELAGKVHYEHYLCARGNKEMMKGRQTTYDGEDIPYSEKLSESEGWLRGVVWPEPDGANKSLVLKHEVTANELSATLASLTPAVDVADIVFNDRLGAAFKAVADASFPTPKPLVQPDTRVLSAAFGAGAGGTGLSLTAGELVPVPEDKVAPLIIELLAASSGQAGT